MNDHTTQKRMFSPWARIALAVFSLLFALILTLWASDQSELWKYSPALFCFAIFGATVLPVRMARRCGYAISLTVVVVCVQVIVVGFKEWSVDYLVKAAHLLLTFGLPALVFLARGRAPFAFGKRPNNALERTRER